MFQPRKGAILSPAELNRFKNLLVFARATVEGALVGKHRSKRRGTSAEFADYKEYAPGDEINRIDWRVFGRSRRLYTRQSDAETDMTVYLLVDVSGSMEYGDYTPVDKFLLAARIAAALAYLMIQQGDKAALGLYAESLLRYIPPGGTRRHLHNLVAELEAIEPFAGTNTAGALAQCAAVFKKRGRLVILSDFWDNPEAIFDALSRFLHRGFDILLLHIVHPHEMDLPGAHAARFVDMESGEEVQLDPEEIRGAYRTAARERVGRIAREANDRRIDHALITSGNPYIEAIEAYLGFRGTNNLGLK
jgi:uncharacterized protein (DUF58 family)